MGYKSEQEMRDAFGNGMVDIILMMNKSGRPLHNSKGRFR